MVHSEQYLVAGLIVNVYTLHPLTHSTRPVVALFFLHGRNGSASKVQDYTKVILESSCSSERDKYDLLVITFVCSIPPHAAPDRCLQYSKDHRNHGSRLRNSKSNASWNKDPKANNERHA